MTTPKTGMDYTRLETSLVQSKIQKDNPALYQTIHEVIHGSKIFQGFLEGRYNDVQSNLSQLFLGVETIITELGERNSTKFSASLTNSIVQSLVDSTLTPCTFNTVIFDDGLMQTAPTNITINANAQWFICGRVLFPAGTSSIRRVSVHLNSKRQFSSQFSALSQEVIIPFSGLIECLIDDVITVCAYQESGASLDIIPSVQLYRVSYVNRGSGRNLIEGDDGSNGGGGGGGGTTGCTSTTPPPGAEVPLWFSSLLTSHGATNCYSATILAAMESELNALNYYLQRDSGGVIRGRLFYPTPTHYDNPIDVPRNDGGWTWHQW